MDILTALIEERTAPHTFKDMLALTRALGTTLNTLQNRPGACYEFRLEVSAGETDVAINFKFKGAIRQLRYSYEILECLGVDRVSDDTIRAIQELSNDTKP